MSPVGFTDHGIRQCLNLLVISPSQTHNHALTVWYVHMNWGVLYLVRTINSSTDSMYGMSVNAAPCVSVILTMREMSVILTQIDLLSVKLTHSRDRSAAARARPSKPAKRREVIERDGEHTHRSDQLAPNRPGDFRTCKQARRTR